MTESGLRTKGQDMAKCYSETDLSMMENGTLIKFMEKESISPATEIGTRDHSTMG